MEKPSALKAPLFRSLVERLEAGGRHVILDLGAASNPMLALLGQFRCRVDIADLASDGGLERMNADAEGDDLVARAESLLPRLRANDAGYDLVYCWDLPNYLKPAALSALMSAIAARTGRTGLLAHALIVYSERTMPERPGGWVPMEDLTLVDRNGTSAEVKAPRYSPEDLGRMMSGFEIDRARLLANGMQEMLFRLPM
ncbi:MAG TPA: hypothetical protein VFG91_01255 [Woeseiaceae bacterium]|nr:hypothetical protein [Woeseiaceae bacterium]